MSEADMSTTSLAFQQGDDRTFALFFMHPIEDKKESLAQGRPVFKEVPFIRIMVPGDKGSIVERPVRPQDHRRYPKQWDAFEKNQEQPMEGTPLSEWPGISRSQVEELKHFGVRTVEDLINVPDSAGQKFMGMNSMKAKAKDYVEAAKGLTQITELREIIDQQKAQIEELMAALQEKPKASRSRKKATESEVSEEEAPDLDHEDR